VDSNDQRTREAAVANWIGRTGLPSRTVEDEDFVEMMHVFDRRFAVPKKAKICSLADQLYSAEKLRFKDALATARKVSIGMDIWTKKGMTASFLGVSACFFCTKDNKPKHILLSLGQISHPHTGQSIKEYVDHCLSEWEIPQHKVLTVITDNGSNMVAAFKAEVEEGDTQSTSSDEEEKGNDSDPSDDGDYRYGIGVLERTPCVVHTLQLVVNMIQKDAGVSRLLEKVRAIVRMFRRSSKATEMLLEACGLCLTIDCPTRWSSTYNMIARLHQVKEPLSQLADQQGWDSLLPSEWQKLMTLKELLLPFAEHTKLLQSDTMSLSLVVPAIVDLITHLSECFHSTSHKDLTALSHRMKVNMVERFSCFMDVQAETFCPLAATACLLDPTVATETLIENEEEEIKELVKQAEDYIVQSLPEAAEDAAVTEESPSRCPSPKKARFHFFSKPNPKAKSATKPCVRHEIRKYKEVLLSQPCNEENGIAFWLAQSSAVFPALKSFALDLLAMPASQAFAERVFSVTGDLTRGKRNRARIHLERSAFLKMNKNK